MTVERLDENAGSLRLACRAFGVLASGLHHG